MSQPKPVLYLDDITVSFDGFRALNSLSFVVEAGEMRTIIGPNGAGKTTMMDVITGKTRPDKGTALFKGTHDLTALSEETIANLGIGRKFQRPTVFDNHTVFENLELALQVVPLFARLSDRPVHRDHDVSDGSVRLIVRKRKNVRRLVLSPKPQVQVVQTPVIGDGDRHVATVVPGGGEGRVRNLHEPARSNRITSLPIEDFGRHRPTVPPRAPSSTALRMRE